MNECSMAFRYTHRRAATVGTSARATACVIPMAICRRTRRPLDGAIIAVADIPCHAVKARMWTFGMAAATRTGPCLADFRTGPSIIDTDGRRLSGGLASAGRKPCAVTDLNPVKRFRWLRGFETIYPANETSFLIRRRPPETSVRHNLTSNDSGGCHEYHCKRSRQRTSGTANL